MRNEFLTAMVAGLLLFVPALGTEAGERPFRIAFVDSGNTGRSITSQALAEKNYARMGMDVKVVSRAVNLNPYNMHPEENFVELLRADGMDISRNVAAQFGPPEAAFTDLILTMTQAHKAWIVGRFPEVRCRTFTLAEYAVGANEEIPDAFGRPMEVYRAAYAQLTRLVAAAADRIRTEELYKTNRIGPTPACAP